jgi:hypothetical protein
MNDFLYKYSENVYSQNGEDGINRMLLEKLNIDGGVVLEIGAWDGFHFSNCANLWSKNNNYQAILIEAEPGRLDVERLENQFENIDCYNELVSLDNSLENIVDRSKFEVTNENFILASIDIDGDDLNVAKSLGKYRPMIMIVEPNGNIIERTNPQGTTVKEWVDYGLDVGYTFIGMSGVVDFWAGNVYLVRNDMISKFVSITELPWCERGVLWNDHDSQLPYNPYIGPCRLWEKSKR